MKKLTAILLAALMLLTSCSQAPSETAENPDTSSQKGGEIISYSIDTENLDYLPQAGIVDSTLRHAGDVTSFKSREQVADFLTTPYSQISGDCTYIMRIFPEELASAEEYNSYVLGDRRNFGIEIYKTGDYTEPVETVYLEGFEGKRYSPAAFTYDPETERFSLLINEKIGDDYEHVLYIFSYDGKLIRSTPADRHGYEKYIICGEELYAVRNNGNVPSYGRLVRSNPFEDSEQVIHEEALCVFISSGSLCYIAREVTADYVETGVLYSYDSASGSSTEIMKIDSSKHITAAVYDSENGILYYSDFSFIYAVKDGEIIPVLSTYDAHLYLLYIQNGYLAVQVGYNQLSLYMTDPEPESLDIRKVELNVCLPYLGDREKLWSNTLEIMNAAGLAVNLNITYSAENSSEYTSTMAKKLLSGDSDFDLYIVTPEMQEIIREEFFADLEEFEVLRDRFEHMIPGLSEVMTVGGKKALIPQSLTFSGVFYQDPAYTDEFELPASYSELFRAPENLPDDLLIWSESDIFDLFIKRFDLLVSNFMAGTISDERAEKDILALFEEAVKAKKNPDIYLGQSSREHPAVYRMKNYTGTDCGSLIPFAAVGEDYKNPVGGSFFAMNPNSPSKTLAAAFLAYFISSGEEWETNNLYYSDLAERYIVYSETRTPNGMNTRENYAVFCAEVENSIRSATVAGFGEVILDLLAEIDQGEVTPAEAAAEAFRYMKMARDE